MYSCPRCGEPGISFVRRWTLGPAVNTTCSRCGGAVGVPWRSVWSFLPAGIGFAVLTTLDGSPAATVILVAGIVGTFLVYARLAPLIPK